MLFYILVMIAGIAVDQLTKLYAINVLAKVTTVPIIPNVFHLTYVENTGAAFSMLSGMQPFLIIITIIFTVALSFFFYILPKNSKYFNLNLSLSLIISGAIGNLIDRIRFQYVVDFFDFRIIGFAIFNIADILVVVGCILMVITIFQNKIPKSRRELEFHHKRKNPAVSHQKPAVSERGHLSARPATKRKISEVKPKVNTEIEHLSKSPDSSDDLHFTVTPPEELPSALTHKK